MPANKYALLRYRIIDRCIRNGARPFPSREDLREACEEALFGSGADAISLSTIDKDIWAMKNEGELGYYAPISFSRQHGGYFYEDPEYSITSLSLGDDELESLRFAAAILNQFRDVPLLENYSSAVEKITNRLNISANPLDEKLDRFIQFETSTVSRGNQYLGPLLQAAMSRKTVMLVYRKFSSKDAKQHQLHPYLLKEYHNRWYLVAFDTASHSVRTFGLERIESLEVTRESFTVSKEFNSEIFFRHSIGITERQEKPHDVVLSFSPLTGRYLITQPVHHSQKVLTDDEHEVRISLSVLLTPELSTFILGYGNLVKVIKPAVLRKEIERIHTEAAQLYKKD